MGNREQEEMGAFEAAAAMSARAGGHDGAECSGKGRHCGPVQWVSGWLCMSVQGPAEERPL